MSCNVCFSKFDHSKHKPYFLSSCPHTFCIDCLRRLQNKSCPMCKQSFNKMHPNLSLLELIPESEFDKALRKLEQTYKSTTAIRSNLYASQKEKSTNCLSEINEIKKQINKTCEEAIKQIKIKREFLINQACSYETNVIFTQEFSPNSELNRKINLAKTTLDSNHSCDLNELCAAIDSLNSVKDKLNQMLNDVNNYKSFEFIPSYSIYSFEIGELIDQSKTFEEYKQIGDKFYEMEQYDSALVFYDKAIIRTAQNKNLSGFFVSIGNVFSKLKEYNNAFSWYEQAIMQDETNHSAFFLKAQLSMQLNKHDDALEAVNRALKLDSRNKQYAQVKSNLLATINPKEPDHDNNMLVISRRNFMLKTCKIITEYFLQNILSFFVFAFIVSIFVAFPLLI